MLVSRPDQAVSYGNHVACVVCLELIPVNIHQPLVKLSGTIVAGNPESIQAAIIRIMGDSRLYDHGEVRLAIFEDSRRSHDALC